MKLDYLKEKEHLVPFALLGVSALLAVLTLVKVVDFFVTSSRAGSLVRKAVEQNKSDDDVEKHLATAKAMADDLKKKNLFVPVPPKRNPVTVVLGILGDEALINGKWYKAGDSVGDAKVVAIEPTRVRIEWGGKETVFAPISAAVASGSSRSGRPGMPGRPDRGDSGHPGASMTVAAGGPGRGGFGSLSEEQRAQMRARFEGMRDRFQNMSEEERGRFREEMRGRFGGGMRGSGGGMGGPGGGRRPGGSSRGGR